MRALTEELVHFEVFYCEEGQSLSILESGVLHTILT